jgi:hypothetical protein
MRNLVALRLCFVFMGLSGITWAAAAEQESTPSQVGYGAGGALGTLVYAPVKGGFCLLGAIGSVFALPFGTERSGTVLNSACRGTWVITPDVLKGREKVQFIGDLPTPEKASKQ